MSALYKTCDNPFFRHLDPARRTLSLKKINGDIQIDIGGGMRKTLDFVTKAQLSDPALWKKFVDQFRLKSDSVGHGWKGEYWGKMMRGAAFVQIVTGDGKLYAVLEETVRDLLTAQDSLGRFSTYTVEQEFHGWDMWARKYILISLECFTRICRDEALKARIISAMEAQADYILAKIGPAEEGKMPIWRTSVLDGKFPVHGAMNSLSVLEPMVNLYRLTGEKRYLDFATYLVEDAASDCGDIFELAYANYRAPYEYRWVKAYEMMSCFEGLLEYYLVTGKEKWRTAVCNFAYRLADTDITVIGSAGTFDETLNHSSIQQAIDRDGEFGQETCVTVTWMKLCARMLLLTGDPFFADCIEQSYYNAYLGALNTENIVNTDGLQPWLRDDPEMVPTLLPFDSYTPLTGGRRGLGVGGTQKMPDGSYYGCCACIGSAGIGIVPYLTLMATEKGFAFNLYEQGVFSAVTPKGSKIRFSVCTDYPASGKIRIGLALDAPEELELALRIPSWSLENRLSLNGKALNTEPGMTVIKQEFKTGDEILLDLDMRVEALRPTPFGRDNLRNHILWTTCEAVPRAVEEPEGYLNRVSIRRGPVILVKERNFTENYGAKLNLTSKTDLHLADISDSANTEITALSDGTKLKAFSNAGKTWKTDTEFCVWMETEEVK